MQHSLANVLQLQQHHTDPEYQEIFEVEETGVNFDHKRETDPNDPTPGT
jgi:hypothetical protein